MIGTRGNGVPRLRLWPVPVVLGVGAIVVPLAGSIAGASAQSNSLLRPELYGDPKGPAVRFQKAAKGNNTQSDLLSAASFQVTSGAGERCWRVAMTAVQAQ